MKLDLYLLTKINMKWLKNSHLRPDTIKFLGENIGKKLLNSG